MAIIMKVLSRITSSFVIHLYIFQTLDENYELELQPNNAINKDDINVNDIFQKQKKIKERVASNNNYI